MGLLKKKFRDIKKFPRWIYFFPALVMKCLYKFAFRHKVDDPDNILETDYPKIGLIWHNRLIFFPCAINKRLRTKTVAIVSASRDGQYISDLISYFGVRCARGSSSRGGAHAQLESIREIKQGNNVALTPDGPRGPIYTLKKGPIQLASVTGAKIILVSINASKYWQLKSWDRFQLPKPGATLTLVVRGAYSIPENLSPEQLEDYRAKIEHDLREITID